MASSPTSSSVQVKCLGVLFDMDGILISSIGSVERSWTKWALLRGIEPAKAIEVAHGRRAIETVAMLRPDLNSRDELKVIEDIEVDDGKDIEILPGVEALLAALPPEQWTVVTSATERLARARMAQAGLPVPERMITADQVEKGKPQPDPYLAGAALLGFPAAECVVFEDSTSGVLAGHAAGCTVIATTFSHDAASLTAADYLITDVTDVEVRTQSGRIELSFQPLRS
ncbi:MAG: HAD-IA family hydrolase [Acidobacteriota bacterium]|nr:HAD-IA family hydrolase [Acidobacteriota bacterium]